LFESQPFFLRAERFCRQRRQKVSDRLFHPRRLNRKHPPHRLFFLPKFRKTRNSRRTFFKQPPKMRNNLRKQKFRHATSPAACKIHLCMFGKMLAFRIK
jgi:hypothetical protein